jgi:hypothetical protein
VVAVHGWAAVLSSAGKKLSRRISWSIASYNISDVPLDRAFEPQAWLDQDSIYKFDLTRKR